MTTTGSGCATVFEPERSLAAFDGDQVVAHGGHLQPGT